MKAHIAQRRLSHAEGMAITQRALECTAPAVTAAVLYILYRRGWHKDRLRALYKDIVALFSYPQAFDKWLTDVELKAILAERVGIDWQELIDAVKVEGKESI